MGPLDLEKLLIGNEAAWALTFHREENGAVVEEPSMDPIGSDRYHAEIEASLPHGLTGGTYTFTIEGMLDEDYRRIAQNPDADPSPPTVVKLYLYWRDTNSDVASYLVNLSGLGGLASGPSSADLEPALVAVLSITKVTRKAGTRRYDTRIEAKERVFHRLRRRVPAGMCLASAAALVDAVGERTGVPIEVHEVFDDSGMPRASDTSELGAAAFSFEQGNTYRQELGELAEAVAEAEPEHRGRGLILIRDGTLHFGIRPIPLEGEPKLLRLSNGFIEAEAMGSSSADPSADGAAQEDPETTEPRRRRYQITLKGRPDIKPGDLVCFDLPEDELGQTSPGVVEALFGSVMGPLVPNLGDAFENPTHLYVESVVHKLGRTLGFSTVVVGVVLDNWEEPWDSHSSAGSRGDAERPDGESGAGDSGASGGGGGAGRASRSVRRLIREALDTRRLTEVGEVRRLNSQGQGSANEAPGQTLTVWRGLEDPDGHPNQAGRLPIQREGPQVRERVAYTSPFAWGKCGLVLPRYPGTRVVVEHRNGNTADPIDIGALWETGHGPDSNPGDWWLSLPVGVDQGARASVDDEATPSEHSGPVTQDLIDADGNRVIEVGELLIRIGGLRSAGTRPERPEDANSVTVEHVDGGSKIVMRSDGSILIEGKSVEIKATDGDITMSANNVNVT